jgi:BirA family transcriptional regulator, biotin operon repressor / biotin---[acetyl-CoA-carboxylase] ligase
LRSIKNTLFIGKFFQDFEHLPSTNEYATELLSKNKPTEGTVISTFNQTNGRGQIGSRWESEPDKNISVSIILYPDFLKSQEQFILSQTIALGVSDFVKEICTDLKDKQTHIKWPNDIYLNNKKIAGILIQNNLSGSQIQSSTIGIGLNTNQVLFSTQLPNASSLSIECKQQFNLYEMVDNLCCHIEKRYLQLRANKKEEIRKEYTKNLFQIGTEKQYQLPDGTLFSGIITAVSPEGYLQVLTENGQKQFGLKEIIFSI